MAKYLVKVNGVDCARVDIARLGRKFDGQIEKGGSVLTIFFQAKHFDVQTSRNSEYVRKFFVRKFPACNVEVRED